MKDEKGIALEYSGDVPRILAKARGRLLERMLEIARNHDITIYKDTDLTELLYEIDPGTDIPEDLYRAVSEVFAYCYRTNKKLKDKIDNTIVS